MKHIILAFLIAALSMGACAFAENYSDNTSYRGSVTQTNYQLQPTYMNWYNIDKDNFRATFRPLTRDQIKNLSAADKAQYKQTEKIEKLLATGSAENLMKAYELNRNYIPTILVYFNKAQNKYNNYKSQQNVNDVVKWINALNNADTGNIFPKDKSGYYLGLSAWGNDQYQQVLNYILPMIQTTNPMEDYDLYKIVASAYYYMNDYNNAIKYASIIPQDSKRYEVALGIIATSYSKLGNKQKAYEYYKKELQVENPKTVQTAWNIAQNSSSEDEKLYYYQQGKKFSKGKGDISFMNSLISEIYSNKLNNATKSISGYYSKPDIHAIVSLGMENELTHCLNYRGNDLKQALSDLNNKVERKLDNMAADQRAAQQRTIEEQRLYAIQRQNRLQAQQNQLLEQQNKELRRPHYSTTTYTKYGSYTTHY